MSYEPPQYPQQQPLQPPQGYGYPMPPQPAQPGWMPPAPVKKSNNKKIFAAIVGGVLVLCCGGIGLAALTDDKSTTATPAPAGGTARQESAPEQAAQKPEGQATEKPAAEPKADGSETFNIAAGSKITYENDGAVVEAVMRSVKTHKQACNSLNVDPENGMFVVVDLVVTQTKGKGSVNPLHFEFVAEDGTSANALSAAFSGCAEPSLAAADLRAGQKRAGKIAFDASMKNGTLEWTPDGLLGDAVGSWAIK